MTTNKFIRVACVVLTSLVMMMSSVAVYSNEATKSSAPAPGALVNELFQEISARLNADQKAIESDPSHLLQLGEEMLGPYVAFDKMARRVLGKNWKKITKDQQQRYTKAFKKRVSISMVSQYDPEKKYTLDVVGEKLSKKKNKALVKSKVKEVNGSSSYAIDYRLYLNKKSGNWQVYDVIVEGISVLQSFGSASAESIKKDGIEKVIEQLAIVVDKNSSPETGGAAGAESKSSKVDDAAIEVTKDVASVKESN